MRYRLERTIEAVAALGCDLVALQEVDVLVPRSGFAHQARRIARATGMNFVFAKASREMWVGRRGNALLVRGSFDNADVIRLPRGATRPRVALLAGVVTSSGRLTVAATHLSIHRSEAILQLAATCAALAVRPEPWLLLGDLNLGAPEVEETAAPFGLHLAGGGSTFPASKPRVQLDHIAGRGLILGHGDVVDTLASDHRPLVARVDLS